MFTHTRVIGRNTENCARSAYEPSAALRPTLPQPEGPPSSGRIAGLTDDLRERLESAVWTSGGCRSWYLDADGGTSVIWPGYAWQFRRALGAFDPQAYELRAHDHAAVA
jgi:hypothetical protein